MASNDKFTASPVRACTGKSTTAPTYGTTVPPTVQKHKVLQRGRTQGGWRIARYPPAPEMALRAFKQPAARLTGALALFRNCCRNVPTGAQCHGAI